MTPDVPTQTFSSGLDNQRSDCVVSEDDESLIVHSL